MATIRRYDIDWLRVIAIGLLLIYHSAIGFQSWSIMIGFISNSKTWESLWTPMSMLNVWRIPFLFYVSGMGVYFAIQNRNWKQLIVERSARIGIPFLFGMFFIVPIGVFISQYHYHWRLTYTPNPGHLWFLGNIFIYVVVLSPLFFFLKRNQDAKSIAGLIKVMSSPWGMLLVIAAFVAEVLLVNPNLFEVYAMTWHGFFIGLLAFFFGFLFVLSGASFWNMIFKWRWLFLSLATMLYAYRLFQLPIPAPSFRLAIESNLWVISIFAFGYRYLNQPSKILDYLSQAAYPVYILHMIFLSLGSVLIFPLNIPVAFQFILVLLFTGVGCFATYEFVIRRTKIIRPLFGLKLK
jgi:glucan biosynthesis protein C